MAGTGGDGIGEETGNGEARVLAIDVAAIMKQAKEDATDEVRFTFTTDETSSTFAASIPDCNSMEMGYKVRHVGALAHLLLEQSYVRDGYKTDCEDEDRHDRWDKSIA